MNENETPPIRDLGWANSDATLLPRLAACRKAGHDTGDRNLDMTHHGYDRVYWCNTCGYSFHCDSSG